MFRSPSKGKSFFSSPKHPNGSGDRSRPLFIGYQELFCQTYSGRLVKLITHPIWCWD